MKKIILQSFIGVFSIAMVTGCGKDVKTPSNKPLSATKTSSAPSSTVTQTSNSDQNNNTCGSQSGGSGSSNSSGTYGSNGY